MGEPHATWSNEVTIASDTANAGQILDQLLEQMQLQGWQDHDVFAVHLAVEEALVNAIKHGNRKDATKSVVVSMTVSPEQVTVAITDEGEGFNPSDVPDPTDEDNLELPSGRGLMLMRTYMTSVAFNQAGNRVVMTKRRSPPVEDHDEEDDAACA